jgi:hypothetical protein
LMIVYIYLDEILGNERRNNYENNSTKPGTFLPLMCGKN